MTRARATLLFLVALLLAPSAGAQEPREAEAEADEGSEAEERRARPSGLGRLLRRPEDPRITGGVLFDHDVRRVLRADNARIRSATSTASDVLLLSLLVAPNVTAVFHSFHEQGHPSAAGELVLVNFEAHLGAALTIVLLKNLAGRQRPYAWEVALDEACRDPDLRETLDCALGRNASFASGHAATAFTGAGLVCAQMAYFGREDPAWDVLSCATATAAAATTAVLRIVADRHWATDTIAGSLIGLGWGLAVPTLLHFREGAALPVAEALRTREDRPYAALMLGSAAGGVALAALVPLIVALVGVEDDPLEDVLALRVGPVGEGGGLGVGVDGVF